MQLEYFEPRIIKFYTDLHADLVYSRTGYDVTSYFRSAFIEVEKTTENAAVDGVESNFSGAAFCLPRPLVHFFFIFPMMPIWVFKMSKRLNCYHTRGRLYTIVSALLELTCQTV